jgi:hypothetical protein
LPLISSLVAFSGIENSWSGKLWKYCLICDSVLWLYMLPTTLPVPSTYDKGGNLRGDSWETPSTNYISRTSQADTTRQISTEQTVFFTQQSSSFITSVTNGLLLQNTTPAVEAYVDLQPLQRKRLLNVPWLSGTKAFRLDNDISRLIWFSTTRCPNNLSIRKSKLLLEINYLNLLLL